MTNLIERIEAAECGSRELDVGGIQKRMAYARRARKMSLDEVASAAGMSKSHIWEMEKGRSTNPTVKAVWAISGALCVSPAWLLGINIDETPIDPIALQIAGIIDRALKAKDTSHDG